MYEMADGVRPQRDGDEYEVEEKYKIHLTSEYKDPYRDG